MRLLFFFFPSGLDPGPLYFGDVSCVTEPQTHWMLFLILFLRLCWDQQTNKTNKIKHSVNDQIHIIRIPEVNCWEVIFFFFFSSLINTDILTQAKLQALLSQLARTIIHAFQTHPLVLRFSLQYLLQHAVTDYSHSVLTIDLELLMNHSLFATPSFTPSSLNSVNDNDSRFYKISLSLQTLVSKDQVSGDQVPTLCMPAPVP